MKRIQFPLFISALLCLPTACGSAADTEESTSASLIDISSESACAAYLTGKAFSNGRIRIEFPEAHQVVITDAPTGNPITQCDVAYTTWADLNEQLGGTSRLIQMHGCAASGLKKVLLRDDGDLFDNETGTAYAVAGKATAQASTNRNSNDRYVLDASSTVACENYLKGKTFTGGTARLSFGMDGSVSAFDQSGTLVFGGTLEIGSAKSDVSRWVNIHSVSGGGKLQLLLSNDGNMMEPSSLVIYKPE